MNIFRRMRVSVENGRALWLKLNKELPRAVGVLEDDVPRMSAYAEQVGRMSKSQKASLRLYLEHLLEFYDDSGDIVSGSVMELCSRNRQICRTHLEYL